MPNMHKDIEEDFKRMDDAAARRVTTIRTTTTHDVKMPRELVIRVKHDFGLTPFIAGAAIWYVLYEAVTAWGYLL
jgi:hypothetical protein